MTIPTVSLLAQFIRVVLVFLLLAHELWTPGRERG